ncbi:MAG: carbon-nitrogen family hydrolase [Thermoanaerobaculia bacterium]|nr:carbon-nitrogen family hydrolase [Thermoanaerobaculia bacterium]
MKVALLQLDTVWEDWQTNHGRAARLLSRAASLGAELAVLPEMFATGFSMDPGRVAQEPGGPTERWLLGMSRGLGLHILAGVAEIEVPRPVNNALLVSPDGGIERFSKLHPFSFAGEHHHYASGSCVTTWLVRGVRVTPLICYDLRFPEVFRLAAEETDVFIVIANWPDRRREHWRTLLRARAVENLTYVVGVNRVGDGDGLHYAGDSAAISPWGETLVSASEAETVLVVEIDPGGVASARSRFPVLSDRRTSGVSRRLPTG